MKTMLLIAALVLGSQTHASVVGFDSSGVNLGIFSEVKCSTGLTCTNTAGQFKLVAASPSFTLENAEVLDNAVDDTVQVISNDEHMTFKVTGFEAKNAILELAADQEDDAADLYYLKADTSNVFSIGNGSTELVTLSTAGDFVFKGTTPYLTVGDAGAEDAGLAFDGNAQDFNISLDDSTDDLVIGLGVAAGTTDAIRIDENQDVTFVQDILPLSTITGDGGAVLVGMLNKLVASTTASITAAQCGSVFVSNSADVMVLPEASTVPGCKLVFVCGTADNFDVDPADTSDEIGIVSVDGAAIDPAAGDAIRCTDAGAGFTLLATGDDFWAVVAHNGVITDVN